MPESEVRFGGGPFEDAIAHFRRKVRVPVTTYRDMPAQMHAKAFMVAGAANDALLADFQQSLLLAMKQGTTLAAFRDDFDRIVKAHGWQYRGEPGWRSAVIFNTNMRTANMAGHWKRMWEDREMHPYLRYVQVQRPTKRPEHAVWHGVILPIEDPFWDAHFPPNGWGCKCTVQNVSNARMKAEGWQVSKGVETFPGDVPEEWAYNVGKAERVSTERESAAFRPLPTARDYTAYGRPETIPADAPRAQVGEKATTRQGLLQAVRKMLHGEAAVFHGPDGLAVGITAQSLGNHLALDRAEYIPFIPEVLEEPYEIWLLPYEDEKTGRVELRRHYIKALALDKVRYGWMIAEFRKGELWDTTFIVSKRKGGTKGSSPLGGFRADTQP